MKSAGTRGHPYFARRAVPIDDDPAALGKLDLQHTASCQLKVDIGATILQRRLDAGQNCVG